MTLSLIYVCRLLTNDPALLDDLQAVSLARNSALDVTGILVVTPGLLAEQLEGPPCKVNAAMASILADQRHHDLRVVLRKHTEMLHFRKWRMLRFAGECACEGGIAEVLGEAYERGDVSSVHRLERLIAVLDDGPTRVRP